MNRKETGCNVPKIGFALLDYLPIDDNTFYYLTQVRFGEKSFNYYNSIC